MHAGTLYVQMGRWEEGEKELRRALDLNPHHHGANNNLKVAQHYKMKQNGWTNYFTFFDHVLSYSLCPILLSQTYVPNYTI